MDVGARIKELREAKDWTTNRLANSAGLSQSFLRDVETGKKGISVENLDLLCTTLNLSLKSFFDVPTERDTSEDILMRQISQMTPLQKEALSRFISSMQ